MVENGRAAVLAKNSLANLVRVASTSLVALAMPLMLVGVLPQADYAEWALLFGLAGFVLYLDFGLPASVQTLVSRALAGGREGEARGRAVWGVIWAALIGGAMVAGLLGLGMAAGVLFPALPRGDGARILAVIMLVGSGNVATFVGNTAAAYFAGQQRSTIPALVLVPGRIASLVLAASVAALTHDLVMVAVVYALPLVVGGLAIVAAVLRSRCDDTTRAGDPLAVLRFSGPLAAWSVYMLCISGAGIVIVGRFDFRAVAIFSLAAAFSASLTGVLSALVSPMLSELGRSHEDRARFTAVTSLGTRVTATFVVLGVVGIEALYLVATPFLRQAQSVPVWEAGGIVAAAVLAAGIRLTMSPLTFAFVAAGAHRKLLLPPLCEAVVTLGSTALLGALLGGLGVACGLVVGAVSGVIIALLWSHRITGVVEQNAGEIALSAVFRPAVALLPAQVLFAAVTGAGGVLPLSTSAAIGLAMLMVTGLLAWRLCLPSDLRSGFAAGLRRRLPAAVVRS